MDTSLKSEMTRASEDSHGNPVCCFGKRLPPRLRPHRYTMARTSDEVSLAHSGLHWWCGGSCHFCGSTGRGTTHTQDGGPRFSCRVLRTHDHHGWASPPNRRGERPLVDTLQLHAPGVFILKSTLTPSRKETPPTVWPACPQTSSPWQHPHCQANGSTASPGRAHRKTASFSSSFSLSAPRPLLSPNHYLSDAVITTSLFNSLDMRCDVN